MALELRPNCECCDKDLPSYSAEEAAAFSQRLKDIAPNKR